VKIQSVDLCEVASREREREREKEKCRVKQTLLGEGDKQAWRVLVSFDDLFVFSPCQVTRGHAFKLFKRQNTHCVRANFFSERVINCWNSLSDSVDFNSFTTFRRTVKEVDFSRFLRH